MMEESGDRSSSSASPASSLITLQSEGTGIPIFFAPVMFGMASVFTDIARHLGDDRPFHTFVARGIDDGQEPFTRIDEAAAYYIEAIRSVKPRGPYFLGGWSYGGFVAFEMAQQLKSAGEEVAALVIVDTVRYPEAPPEELLQLNMDAVVEMFPQLSRSSGLDLSGGLETALRRILPLAEAHLASSIDYVFHPYDGRIIYLRVRENEKKLEGTYPGEMLANTLRGWDTAVIGSLEVHSVPGTHFTAMLEPNVRETAAVLRGVLREIDPTEVARRA